MNISRKTVGAGLRKAGATTGLAAAALLTVAAMAPAQAAPTPGPAPKPPVTVTDGAKGAKIMHLGSSGGTETRRAAPSTSPAVTHVYLPSGSSTTCPSGYACAAVPYGSGWYVFKFYDYGGYSLSYWGGKGQVVNNQTGTAAMRIDNVNGGQVRCFPPTGIVVGDIDWDPIWRVRLTSSGC